MRKYLLPLAAAAALLSSSSAFAAQATANFQARVTIQTSCLVTAGSLDFGNVGVINGGETASSTVNVNCSAGTAYAIGFDTLALVTSYTGAMVNGLEDVAYSAALSGAAGVGPQTFTISGILPAQVTPTPAIYTDNRTVYVNY
jgi:spore coat protein U-like protein